MARDQHCWADRSAAPSQRPRIVGGQGVASDPDQWRGDKPIVIRISEELHAALKQRAQEEERPVSQVMRRALRQYLGFDLRQGVGRGRGAIDAPGCAEH